jgi:hypothetical protein
VHTSRNGPPKWYTQGGGIVIYDSDNQSYVFIVAPDVPGLEIGDFMPDEWSVVPIEEKPRQRVTKDRGW